MIRRILKNSAMYSIRDVVEKVLGLILVPIYTAYMKPEDFGVVSLMTLLVTTISVIFMAGQPNAIMRLYFDYKSDELKEVLTSTVLYLVIIPLFLSFILIVSGERLFGFALSSVPFYPMGFLTVLTAYFLGIPQYLLALWRAQEKLKEYLVFSTGMYLATTLLVLFFVVKMEMGGYGKVLGAAIAGGAVWIFALALIIKDFSPSISLPKLKQSLVFGWPLVPHQLAVTILSLFDRYMLERFTDLSKVGIYSLGYSLGSVGLFVSAGFGQAWGPFFYSMAGKEQSPRLFARISTYFYYFIAIITAFLVLFSNEITVLLASSAYQDAHTVIPVVALGVFLNCLYIIPIYTLYFYKKTTLIPILTLISAVVNIVMNYFLIPAMGMMGAAWATAISYTVMLLLVLVISQKLLHIPYEWRRILVFSCGVCGIVALDFFFFGETQVDLGVKKIGLKMGELLLAFGCIFVGELFREKRSVEGISQ